MWVIIGILAIIVIGAVILVVVGLRSPQSDEDALQERLREFTSKGDVVVDLEELELSQPFSERIVYPLARKLGEIAVRFTPQNALQATEKRLELAGNPGRMDPTTFLALRFICMVVFGGLMILVFSISKLSWSAGTRLLVGFTVTLLGFFMPELWLSSSISRRQKSIRKSLPDALDLLTICVEAGLGFDAAMNKVVEKWDSDLSLAFARALREVQLGKLRREALRDMADRIGLPEMTSFVAAVIQSEQLGVSMAKVLRIQADQMRLKRRQFAEEKAHQAPIIMLIPMALLIFPTLMIVLMTPAALRLAHSALGGMLK
ncbi:MAG TPA: type II secretion system F family protein [Anaerolineaceae bacterium]|nr:type II secretion system F family protein [Anaerolineaceae bacterium]